MSCEGNETQIEPKNERNTKDTEEIRLKSQTGVADSVDLEQAPSKRKMFQCPKHHLLPPILCSIALLLSYVGFTSCHLIDAKIMISKETMQEEDWQNLGVYCSHGLLEEIIENSSRDKLIWGFSRVFASLAMLAGFASPICNFFLIINLDIASTTKAYKECLPSVLAALFQVLTMVIFSSSVCTQSPKEEFEALIFEDLISLESIGCKAGYGIALIVTGLGLYILTCYIIYQRHEHIPKEVRAKETCANDQSCMRGTNGDHDIENPIKGIKRSQQMMRKSTNPALINLIIDVSPNNRSTFVEPQVSEPLGTDDQGLQTLNAKNLGKFSTQPHIRKIDLHDYTLQTIDQALTALDNSVSSDKFIKEANDNSNKSPPRQRTNSFSDVTTSTFSPVLKKKESAIPKKPRVRMKDAPDEIFRYENNTPLVSDISDTEDSRSNIQIKKVPNINVKVEKENIKEQNEGYQESNDEEGKTDEETRRKRDMWIDQLQTSFRKNEDEKLRLILHSKMEGSQIMQYSSSEQSSNDSKIRKERNTGKNYNFGLTHPLQKKENDTISSESSIKGLSMLRGSYGQDRLLSNDGDEKYQYTIEEKKPDALYEVCGEVNDYNTQTQIDIIESTFSVQSSSEADSCSARMIRPIRSVDYDGDLDETDLESQAEMSINPISRYWNELSNSGKQQNILDMQDSSDNNENDSSTTRSSDEGEMYSDSSDANRSRVGGKGLFQLDVDDRTDESSIDEHSLKVNL